jgi:hypothetical protein
MNKEELRHELLLLNVSLTVWVSLLEESGKMKSSDKLKEYIEHLKGEISYTQKKIAKLLEQDNVI